MSSFLNVLGAQDAVQLQAVSRGEHLINGFRNRDIRALLSSAQRQGKKESAAQTRKLRLLRAHELITKVPSTHRYVLSEKGRSTCRAAILAARQADTTRLVQAA